MSMVLYGASCTLPLSAIRVFCAQKYSFALDLHLAYPKQLNLGANLLLQIFCTSRHAAVTGGLKPIPCRNECKQSCLRLSLE